RIREMSFEIFCATSGIVGSSTLRSRASRHASATSDGACSGRYQMPGRAPALFISAASDCMSPNLSFPWSHVPAPDLSLPRPGCQPSSITANGRFEPVGERSTMFFTSVRTLDRLFLPYAQYQSLLPYIGSRGSRGFAHIPLQKACIAANDL